MTGAEVGERSAWQPALGRPRTSSGDALVIVAKFPKAHEVKTRLGASIGYENAAQLYRAFLCDLSERFATAQGTVGYHLYWSCGPTIHVLATVIGPDATILPQRGEEFADRLHNISLDAAAAGYQRLVIMGSDSPQLPPSVVRESFERLDERDVVVGPADDCGYYLIGLHLYPEPPNLFSGIRMSTSLVLAETLIRAADLDCSVALMAPAFDVDEVTDLPRLQHALHAPGAQKAPHTVRELHRLGKLKLFALVGSS